MLRKVVDVPPCRSRPVGASPSSSSRLRLHLLLLLQLLQDPRHHHQLRATHSEGESLREGGKKRLGGNMHPQNGDIGGCEASCVASEDYTIDQARILGKLIISVVRWRRHDISYDNRGFHNWPGAHSGQTWSAARPECKNRFLLLKINFCAKISVIHVSTHWYFAQYSIK